MDATQLVLIAVGAVAFIVLLGMVLIRMESLRFVATVMMTISVLGVATDWYDRVLPTWLLPVQMRRSEIYAGFSVLFAFAALFHFGRIPLSRVSMQGLTLMFAGVFIGGLRLLHHGLADGLLTIALALLATGSMTIALPGLLHSYDDCVRLLRSLALANLFWALAIFVQAAINPSGLMLGGTFRFTGLTANPQAAALALDVLAVVCLWLAMNDSRWRVVWIGLLSVDVLMLMWTGSRTGALLFLIGAASVLYSRVGRAIFLMPVAGLGALLLYKVAGALVGSEGVGSSAQRLLSTENTRAGGWRQLLEVGLANPLLGVGVDDTGASENSYLLALAAYGIGGLFMVLLVAAVSAFVVLRLLRLRFGAAFRTPYGGLIDLVVGFNAMYFIGAVLEGYIVARISPLLFSMLIFGALGAYLPHGVEMMWDEGFEGEWDPDEETPDDHASAYDGYSYGDDGDDPAGAYG